MQTDLARKFVEQVKAYTDYNVNIMNESGYIIASCDPKRIGMFHEIAYSIICDGEDKIEVSENLNYPDVLPGVNMVVNVDGKRDGVIGITGRPDEVRTIALFAKLSLEAAIRYEKHRNETTNHKNQKELFINMLINKSHPLSSELRRRSSQFGYTWTIPRIPILFTLSDNRSEVFLESLKQQKHSKEDISFELDDSTVIVFKSLPKYTKSNVFFSDYKLIVKDYIHDTVDLFRKENCQVSVYVGSIQNNLMQYSYAYKHCRWLENFTDNTNNTVFFYDYLNAYVHTTFPSWEMQQIFSVYSQSLDQSFKDSYIKILKVLIDTNWNFNKASATVFMHKNTLTYRYNKIKETLCIDPMVSSEDRNFAEAFYYFLTYTHETEERL